MMDHDVWICPVGLKISIISHSDADTERRFQPFQKINVRAADHKQSLIFRDKKPAVS